MGIIILFIQVRNWGSEKLSHLPKGKVISYGAKIWLQDRLVSLQDKNNTLRSFFFPSLQFLPCVPFLRLYWHSKQILSALQTSDWIWEIPKWSPANVTHIYLWDKREKIFNKTYNWKSMGKIIHFRGAWSISLWDFNGRAFAIENEWVDSVY